MDVDEEQLAAVLPPRAAVAAIRQALRDGLDPGADPLRGVLELAGGVGRLVTMPSAAAGRVGLKVVTVAPGNPAHGRPLVQGTYLLFDPETLALAATIDGAALTTLRTPAVSVAAVLPALQRRVGPQQLVVFGAGPQGTGHAATLHDVGVDVAATTYVVRNPDRVDPAAVHGATVTTLDGARAALAEADVIVCATTAAEPLFDGSSVRSDVVVMSVGSFRTGIRELAPALLARSQVIVEDVLTALQESGNVVLAIRDGALTEERLVTMASVVRDEVGYAEDRPIVFTGSGMAWQDLVVAEAVREAVESR